MHTHTRAHTCNIYICSSYMTPFSRLLNCLGFAFFLVLLFEIVAICTVLSASFFSFTWGPLEGATLLHNPVSLFCYFWNHIGISKLLGIDLILLLSDHDFWAISLTPSLFASYQMNSQKLSNFEKGIIHQILISLLENHIRASA